MASYEARRDGGQSDIDAKKEHDHQNSKNTARVAAKGAGAYFGGAVGAKAVDIASKTKVGDKVLDTAAKLVDRTKIAKAASNALNDSGAMKAAETAVDAAASKGGGAGGAAGGAAGANTPNQVKTPANASGTPVAGANKNMGGGQNSSLPSSDGKKNQNDSGTALGGNNKKNGLSSLGDDSSSSEETSEEKTQNKMLTNFLIKVPLRMAISIFGPFLILILFIGAAASYVSGIFGDEEDAINMSATMGEETGNLTSRITSPEQQAFYDRVNDVKTSYQANGKTVDAIAIVGTYHVIKENGGNVSYEKMTTSAIEEIANAMFDENSNSYNEETFKTNLKNNIIPKYISGLSDTKRGSLAQEVIDYVDRYSKLIDKYKNKGGACSSSGQCSYNIKGFYISGKGNITKNMQISNLYVRLMQCDGSYGGTEGQPLAGEDLVPFEKYVLGVAYQEIGPSASKEGFKAQLVASRSYALARHIDMGGWHTLTEEDGKWILQMASCTQDQVYCNPDEGCSTSSGDGQSGIVHSGTTSGKLIKGPIADDSPLRTYASEVEGEVLVNAQGNVIYATYYDQVSRTFSNLGDSGLNYKQILLQVYNQGSLNYGASDINKANCGGNSTNCTNSTGEYTTWKQYEGSWVDIQMGDSGKTIHQIGCLVTSISIQIARSGVKTNVSGEFNPGSFVEYLNGHGGFASGGNFIWSAATSAAPDFVYQDRIYMTGWSKQQKLDKIKELTSQSGVYVVAEVKGNTGQHWVAIDKVNGNNVTMMDPGSTATDLWSQYDWNNTSQLVYYKVG